jgi:hypothetical protein
VLWHHCRFCKHAAKNKSDIKWHEAAHLGDKPFECQYCDDTFTKKHHLVNHERTHTGERPYGCSACDYAAATSSDVTRHIKRWHPGSGAMYIKATGVLSLEVSNQGSPAVTAPAHTCDPSLTTERELQVAAQVVHVEDAVVSASESTPAPQAEALLPVPCHDIDVMDPGLFVRGSLLRLLHATPEQQAMLLATEEYRHLRDTHHEA